MVTEYADDVAILVCSSTVDFATPKLQSLLTEMVTFFSNKSLLNSSDKTKAMIFSSKSNLNPKPIKVNGREVQFVSKFKYLGVTLDSPRLTWKPHIQELAFASNKRANILKALSARAWGADKKTLIMLYKSLVLSKLNYGAELFSTASKENLSTLDKVQNNCLRLILGAELSSPIVSLEIESGIPPLELQRQKLQLGFLNRLRQLPDHLTVVQLLLGAGTSQTLRWSITHKQPLVIRCLTLEEGMEFRLPLCHPYPLYHPCPPWAKSPSIMCSLRSYSNEILDQEAPSLFRELSQSKYRDHIKIYTDGSRVPVLNRKYKVAAGMVVPERNFSDSWKLPSHFSIYSAELYGISRALSYIEGHHILDGKYLICSDSFSALLAIKSMENCKNNSLLWEVVDKYSRLKMQGIEIMMEWVPGHKGIPGNEKADKAAGEAINLGYITNPGSNNQDTKYFIMEHLKGLWKLRWEREFVQRGVGGHLREIRQEILYWPWSNLPSNRKLETMYARLRIGHCGLKANRTRFSNDFDPLCDCGIPETIHHVLFNCENYATRREIMGRDLEELGIALTLKNVLGGADVGLAKQLLIRHVVSVFLASTGLINRI